LPYVRSDNQRIADTYRWSIQPSELTGIGAESKMKRYLICHDDGGTWDLVVEGDVWAVEHSHGGRRLRYGLTAFQESEDGKRLAPQLEDAMQRARASRVA
jgi:hypothetical protein